MVAVHVAHRLLRNGQRLSLLRFSLDLVEFLLHVPPLGNRTGEVLQGLRQIEPGQLGQHQQPEVVDDDRQLLPVLDGPG